MHMTTRRFNGEKLGYRPVIEAELSEAERRRIYGRSDKHMAARSSRSGLLDAAKRDRAGFAELSRWIVATCKSGLEQSISEDLESLGIESWCPFERFRKPPKRGLKAVEIHRAIFRGYLFVRVIPENEAFVGVLSASNIRGIMGKDGRPYLMPEKLMDHLLLQTRKYEKKHMDNEHLPFAPDLIGREFVIRSGPFSDFVVTVRRVLDNRPQAVVLLPLFGGMSEVTIDIDTIMP